MKIKINAVLAHCTINVGFGTHFVYYRYMNHDKKNWC